MNDEMIFIEARSLSKSLCFSLYSLLARCCARLNFLAPFGAKTNESHIKCGLTLSPETVIVSRSRQLRYDGSLGVKFWRVNF